MARVSIDNGQTGLLVRTNLNAMLTELYAGTAFSALALTGQILTGSQATAAISATSTWNTSGTPTLIDADVTDTASNAAALLMNLKLSGTSIFQVQKSAIRIGGGTQVKLITATAYSKIQNTGFANFVFTDGSNDFFLIDSGTSIRSGGAYSWSSSASTVSSPDLYLYRDAAGNLAVRHGTNTQMLRMYGSYTDASNYRRGAFGSFNGVDFDIQTEGAGTGAAAGTLNFGTVGVRRWNITTSGHFLANADNTYDIGGNGANRPRNGFFGSDIVAGNAIGMGAAGKLYSAGRAGLRSTADGVWLMFNNAETDFGRLQFGGTTSSFPALKRSATVLQARLADDSDFAPLQGRLRSNANATAETPTATHTLRLFDAAGTEYKVLAVAA